MWQSMQSAWCRLLMARYLKINKKKEDLNCETRLRSFCAGAAMPNEKLVKSYRNIIVWAGIKMCEEKVGRYALNYLWAGMILIGIVYAAFTGRLPQVTTAALDSAKDAVSLCITMLGVMSFWMGLMKIAENAGLIEALTGRILPLLHFLFPKLPRNHVVNQYLATNMIANVFGLGWAATPSGLKAMAELDKINQENCNKLGVTPYRSPDIATKEMCDFLIINISSLQLIPVNIIAYRTQYGSENPTAIMGPAILATTVGTLVAVIFCKCMPDWSDG